MDTFRKVIRDFRKGENISLLATIILVIITLILDSLGFASAKLVTSVTIALLGLLAMGFLLVRYRIEEMIERQKTIISSTNVIHLLDKFPVLLDEYLEKSDEILMVGLILRTTSYTYYDEFKDRVKKGLKLKVLVTNPHSRYIDIKQITLRFSRGETTELFKAAYDTVLAQYSKIRDAAIRADNVQLRLLDFIPPFSLYIFPSEKEGGVVFVQLYAYKAPEGTTPRFLLTERENPIWYRRFNELYEQMWEDALDYFPED